MNLSSLLETTAGRRSGSVAIAFEGSVLTYGDLLQRARRVAAGLASLGVGVGDRVALWLGNHPAFAEALYGAWHAGATVVPVHAGLTEPEAKHVLSDSGAKVVFAGPSQASAARTLASSVATLERAIVLGDDYDAFLSTAGDPPPAAVVSDDDLALIGYTAGTSGVPKGAMLTHANLFANVEQMRETPIAFGPDDVVLCILPLFHIYGLNVVLNLSVAVGAKIVLSERFDPKASVEAMRSELVTVIAGAPPAYVAWAAADIPADSFSNVRVAVSGAAPLPKEVLEAFRDRFGVQIWEGYGLTETAPALTTTAVGGVAKPGCVGRAVPRVELRLVDEEGEDVEEGDPGEIVVRGPNVFKGYWNRPQETEAAFSNGWFRTGDVGVSDDDGDIYIVDRRKDMVIVSGFNVYPREVEDVLRRHPNVGDVAVVGAPDPQTGEHVRAIVVPDPPGESVTAEALLEFAGRYLAPYKIPKEVEVVSDIPRNAAGKVLRRELKATSDAPEVRRSAETEATSDAPEVRRSAETEATSDAPEVRRSAETDA
jgi:long-chain acyl-CoA synthetase